MAVRKDPLYLHLTASGAITALRPQGMSWAMPTQPQCNETSWVYLGGDSDGGDETGCGANNEYSCLLLEFIIVPFQVQEPQMSACMRTPVRTPRRLRCSESLRPHSTEMRDAATPVPRHFPTHPPRVMPARITARRAPFPPSRSPPGAET